MSKIFSFEKITFYDRKPYDGKLSRTVWSRGKSLGYLLL